MYHKTIKCGNKLIAIKYSQPYDPLLKRAKKKNKTWVYDRVAQAKSRIAQAKAKLRYLCEANPDCRVFLTLTFSPSKCGANNIVDIDWCYMRLRLYFKRIFRKYPYFKAIGVTEFQKDIDFLGGEKEFGGAVHYHFLCNYPWVEKMSDVDDLWQNGCTTLIRLFNNVDAVYYISKYFNKDFNDLKQKGKRSILVYRAKRPEILVNSFGCDYVVNEILDLFPGTDFFECKYQTDFFGEVTKRIWVFDCCIQW